MKLSKLTFKTEHVDIEQGNGLGKYLAFYFYIDGKEIGKEEAMEMLNSLTIPDTLQDHIKKVIEEIKNSDDVDQTNIKKVTSKKGASSTAKVKNNE